MIKTKHFTLESTPGKADHFTLKIHKPTIDDELREIRRIVKESNKGERA